jgi:hypothetical protein
LTQTRSSYIPTHHKASKHLTTALELSKKVYGDGSPEAALSWLALSDLNRMQAQYICRINQRSKQAETK